MIGFGLGIVELAISVGGGDNWILAGEIWADSGVWIDSDIWQD